MITEAVTKGLNPNVKMKPSGVEWIGDIPEEWEVRKLKSILKYSLQYGANESGEEYNQDLPRYITRLKISPTSTRWRVPI
jgi:type I restriction enzyme, S subunit